MSVFIILGMHRSGTSCLTGTLKECGVQLGPINLKGTGNPKGNQEIKAVWQLNEKLMQNHAGDWMNPKNVLSWNDEDRKERDNVIHNFKGLKNWAIKDPRLMFALDFWLEGMVPKPVLLGSFRHPVAVANSLYDRNKTPHSKSLEIWKKYNMRLLEILQEHPVALVCFDASAPEYLNRIKRVTKEFMLSLPEQPQFFEDALRSKSVKLDLPDEESRYIYYKLQKAYNSQVCNSLS